jgi:hypothetical protein
LPDVLAWHCVCYYIQPQPDNLKITANVHTVAQTGLGKVDEVDIQTLGAKLEENTLIFDEELSGSQSGSVDGAAIPGASEEGRSRAPWIIGLVVALLALGYFDWNQTQLGLAMVSAGEAEAARARKKYRQMMVDDLVRIADDLVKPVLHQAEEGRHNYCVIDSGVRYLYVVET